MAKVVSDSFATPRTVAHQAPLSMGFFSKNTGLGCHLLLQGIFPTQGLNPCLHRLLHWQADSLLLGHLGNPNTQIVHCFFRTVRRHSWFYTFFRLPLHPAGAQYVLLSVPPVISDEEWQPDGKNRDFGVRPICNQVLPLPLLVVWLQAGARPLSASGTLTEEEAHK